MEVTENATLLDILEQRCQKSSDKPFLVFEDNDKQVTEYSYGEFLERVERFSGVLAERGIQKGDKVTLHLPNSAEFIVCWFALAKLGAIMVPTNILSTGAEMEYLIGHSESVMLITEAEYTEKFKEIRSNLPKLKDILLTRTTDAGEFESVTNLIEQFSGDVPTVEVEAEDVAAILYTSGTTSKPKGCLITNANYLYTGQAVARHMGFTEEDRALVVLPMFHGNGQYYLIMPSLIAGGSVAITERFSASQYGRQVQRLGATLGSLFAAPIRMILAQKYEEDERNNKLRAVIFAQSVTAEELETFEQRYNTQLYQIYGMTETIAPPLMNPFQGDKDNTSVGKPIEGSRVKLIDEEGNEVEPGQSGEILLAGIPGRTVMKGYFNNPEATNQALQNGWLHTGDKARKSDNGFYYFVDRQKDMIKRAGENVAASEVENVIMEHPAVYEAIVIGIPDAMHDEALKAFVILKEGQNATEQDIIDYCKEQLAKFKVPSAVEFVKDFPRTSVGKIQKHKLKEIELKKLQ
ncbi:AMP-binding protein [Planococcus sp. ISL-109]|uniref:AMP-binding protein n=1 Tax=Planococcus sp. ISL-109 TaxID=2819166 RepID=UPI001BEA8653|nr:AMP-binding protein [Planococcus sp. ISL-109]MBT2583443.1 AMP-binding protein [Planococcus sp. ISL-109]